MKILVTGGAGFIGSHVVEALLAENHDVEVLDNLATGKAANVPAGVPLHEVDIRSAAAEQIIGATRPEVIIHLAAQSSVKVSVDDPVKDLEINTGGTGNIARAAARHGVRKVVYTSTGGALYGVPDAIPVAETHPVRPLSPYGASKYAGEQYLQLAARMSDLQFTILRPANVFGPRQDPFGEAGVVAIFLGRMYAGQPCTIHGDGEQVKDYIHVSDVVRANLRALVDGDGGAFHVSSGGGASVNALFRSLQQLTGDTTPPEHGPAREGDVRDIILDNSNAASGLGWAPQVSFEDGLAQTANAYREALA